MVFDKQGHGDRRHVPLAFLRWKLERNMPRFTEEVEVAGHIIDSLILPKILDEITILGGRFTINDVKIGQHRHDPSRVRLQIEADSESELKKILASIGRHGAIALNDQDCVLSEADLDGAFPEDFYCSTNQETEVRYQGQWLAVRIPEMDCGLRLDPQSRTFETVPMTDVRKGDQIVVGHKGIRVEPHQRDVRTHDAFSFMNSTVSSEKPKGVTLREIAAQMRLAKTGAGRILIVAGPAVVHTGSRDHLSRLIQAGYVNVLFAGNALATHDIEQSLFGTSLGISMDQGRSTEGGHEHHLRTINRIRRLGSIQKAVESGVLTSGIMFQCVQQQVPFVLCGSIRDDGPLPDVITDALESQRAMRRYVPEITFCLMIATTLHSIAVGNLLPARVKVVCVDINPSTVTKLSDRGTFQTVGLVTDVEPFLRVLVQELGL